MAGALSEEAAEFAVLVYVDESFAYQVDGSAYLCFFTDEDEDGVVQDGMGRASGKGLRLIMVHAITKHGPLAAKDGTDFPIKKDWFTAKDKGKGRGRKGRGDMDGEETAEMLWQAIIATGEYHAMTENHSSSMTQ